MEPVVKCNSIISPGKRPETGGVDRNKTTYTKINIGIHVQIEFNVESIDRKGIDVNSSGGRENRGWDI